MISPDNSVLLIIDVQEKFRPVMFNIEALLANIPKLAKTFRLLEIPILVTEQYPKGLGETMSEIKGVLEDNDYVDKTCFDCFGKSEFADLLQKKYPDRKNLIVCGLETHVCIAQTVMSALERDYTVHLVADALSSRKKTDYHIALERLASDGAKIASTEMVIFQLLKDSKHEHFKAISQIVR
ncbi:hydrolase [candidate division KSB1 bacterium]